ncbi:phage antirepressor N-terminal domain-containing protein [Serratia marcescens]|uniref:phage antirepressor N-terminal domain-containing protein n=1 Tax=Serratia marcescens TaxID=615 RepID=UPI00069D3122|nr:phage antirepressor N-terminal domain-containing protein [Serratia marcescens]
MTIIATLEAVSTQSVQFHGQPIITAMASGVAYVAMKPIVENLGLDWPTQHRKLLSSNGKFNHCHMTMVAMDAKIRDVLCIPLRKLNGWLFSINPAKVRADIRDKLISYQEECFTVLHDYWTKGSAVRKPETTVDDRTPLRGIVNRIMGKYGMTYQAVYKLVHKEFGVRHIDELSPKQTSEAIEYLATKAIEGEFMGREDSADYGSSFTEEELCMLCWMWNYSAYMIEHMRDVQPILKAAEHRLAGAYVSMPNEAQRVGDAVLEFLKDRTAHIKPSLFNDWRVLERMRSDYLRLA